MDMDKTRADTALVSRGLAASREKAQALIAAGLATVNDAPIAKPAQKISAGDVLRVIGEIHPYVSRGGLKLEKAIRAFDVTVSGQVCLDIGASTGGFTDVLLRNGALHVYAIDVGTGQLDAGLLADPRVTSMEHVNARTLQRSMFTQAPRLAVMDVSFISIRLILPALFNVLGASGQVIALVKPQFEAGKQEVGKGGIVSSPDIHRRILYEIIDFPKALNWCVRAVDYSPITGGDGNIEYLAQFEPFGQSGRTATREDIDRVVLQAHERKFPRRDIITG